MKTLSGKGAELRCKDTQEATNPIAARLTFSYRDMTSSMKFMLESHAIELPFFSIS